MGNLRRIIPVTSTRQSSAARDLVAFKDRLDDAIQDVLVRNWIRYDVGLSVTNHAVDGEAFVAAVIPFSRTLRSSPRRPALVPLEQVIGTSWRRGYGGEFAHKEAPQHDEVFLLDPNRATPSDFECAQVIHIPRLGVFVAHEGKNRIRFLRDRGNTHYPALITDEDYPSTDRIRLYDVHARGVMAVWAVLDGRWVTPLPFPALTRMVLDPYGVPAPSPWPAHWPQPETLLYIKDETNKPGSCYPRRPGMDLALAREYESQEQKRFEDQEAWVAADLADLFDQLRPSRFGWAVVLIVTISFICGVTMAGMPAWFKAGSVGAGIVIFTLMLPKPRFWLAKKSLVDEQLHRRTRLRSLKSFADRVVQENAES